MNIRKSGGGEHSFFDALKLRECQSIKVSKYQSKVQGTLMLVLYL